MKKIQLWAVEDAEDGQLRAASLDEMESAKTEQRLEELLVASADLLLDGLTLVARQLHTDSGFPDLVGVDEDGRLVLLELKRGTLTRDAVAQILDYASDFRERDPDDLSRLIEDSSGKAGIDEIEDFQDWHGREYPDKSEALEQDPRLVLVGLGADERAKRIVNFLAESGIDIRLLTFHAFDLEGRLILAKQVETVAPSKTRSATSGLSKEEGRRQLMALADQQGVRDLLIEVADFIKERMPCYRWPGKTAYSFTLQDRTDDGAPTWRSYVTLWVERKMPGRLALTLSPRVLDIVEDETESFVQNGPGEKTQKISTPVRAEITADNWGEVQPPLERLLQAIVEGLQDKIAAAEAEEESSQRASASEDSA